MAATQQDLALEPACRDAPLVVDVVVVGASLGGLQAALRVQAAGASCLLLEASDVVGGRRARDELHGDDDAAGVAGCAFDARRHPRLADLARRFRLDPATDDDVDVSRALAVDALSPADARALARVLDNVDALCQRVDVNRPAELLPNYGAASVRDLVASQGATPAVHAVAAAWTQTLFGLASDAVSALSFLVHCKTAGGLHHTIRDNSMAASVPSSSSSSPSSAAAPLLSTATLAAELAARLHPPSSLLLHSRVQRILQTPAGGVNVVVAPSSPSRPGRLFHCRAVILAAAVDQCRAVDFVPGLGPDKRWLRDPATTAAAARAVPAARLRDLERDQWRPEGALFFAGSATSFVSRGHAEGALAAGTRAADEVLAALHLTPPDADLTARL